MSGLGFVGAGGAALAANSKSVLVDGQKSWSESVMVVYLSDDLKTGVSYRISRFPDLGQAWVWCNVIADGRMYAYTDQYLPCDSHRNTAETDTVVYEVPGSTARMTRVGTSADLNRLSFSIAVGAHAGTEPHEGAGPVPIAVEGIFYPEHMHPRMLPGRFERTGRVQASLRVGAKTYAISGVCKQHEQTQMEPRFGQSFTYCDLWNDRASLLGLLTARGSAGDFQVSDQSRAVKKFLVAKPGDERRIGLVLDDGSTVQGVADASIVFGIPVFKRVWRGTFVSATIGDQKLIGMLNDWKQDEQPYS
jgi:hypothetical protein